MLLNSFVKNLLKMIEKEMGKFITRYTIEKVDVNFSTIKEHHLREACFFNDLETVKKIISETKILRIEHKSFLNHSTLFLCFKNCFEIVQKLVQETSKTKKLNKVFLNDGMIGACYSGNHKILEFLLENSANPNEKDYFGNSLLSSEIF